MWRYYSSKVCVYTIPVAMAVHIEKPCNLFQRVHFRNSNGASLVSPNVVVPSMEYYVQTRQFKN